jgi:hypothetical protein
MVGRRYVELAFLLTSFTILSKCVEFCSEFFCIFSNYLITTVTPCCHVKHVSDTFVSLTIHSFIIWARQLMPRMHRSLGLIVQSLSVHSAQIQQPLPFM